VKAAAFFEGWGARHQQCHGGLRPVLQTPHSALLQQLENVYLQDVGECRELSSSILLVAPAGKWHATDLWAPPPCGHVYSR